MTDRVGGYRLSKDLNNRLSVAISFLNRRDFRQADCCCHFQSARLCQALCNLLEADTVLFPFAPHAAFHDDVWEFFSVFLSVEISLCTSEVSHFRMVSLNRNHNVLLCKSESG